MAEYISEKVIKINNIYNNEVLSNDEKIKMIAVLFDDVSSTEIAEIIMRLKYKKFLPKKPTRTSVHYYLYKLAKIETEYPFLNDTFLKESDNDNNPIGWETLHKDPKVTVYSSHANCPYQFNKYPNGDIVVINKESRAEVPALEAYNNLISKIDSRKYEQRKPEQRYNNRRYEPTQEKKVTFEQKFNPGKNRYADLQNSDWAEAE